ncbi:MAG: enoyl-CoA hydratase/isomerase family protein [Gammaproteobacteria bacterium]|nr:enoyl-CoA hydratase/isomerase family protein [Gammaproteobacteria bacterium]MYD80344.1 enoyl-CoA hydratase/isomerase family protein [Gammaproteobacteria bacterium]
MSSNHVTMRRKGHVVELGLANPPRHTINARGSQELYEQLQILEKDPSVRVIVLIGESDGIFVRHYEVGELADSSERVIERGHRPKPPRSTNAGRVRVEGGLRGAMRVLESMPQVTIAAINGMAHGGGLELALACDFRLAREGEFTLGLPETGVGILPGGGGTQRLARMIGVARALDLILHGSVLDVETALELGIVSRVLPHSLEEFRTAVDEFAQKLALRAPIALAKAKQAIREGIELPLGEGLRREAELFGELMATGDAARALRAVVDGKPIPPFEGS